MENTQKPATDFFDENLKIFSPKLQSQLLLLDKHFTGLEKELKSSATSIAEPSSITLGFAKDGMPVPIFVGKPLHSRYFPKKEAARNVANLSLSPSHYVVLTQDFLYGLEEMCKRHREHFAQKQENRGEKKLHLAWCVADRRLLLQLLHARSLAFLKRFSSIALFFCSSNSEKLSCEANLENYAMAIVKKDFHGFLFFESPHSYFDGKRPFFHRLKTLLAEWGKLLASQKLTETLLQRRWWVNGLLNLASVSKMHFFHSLYNAHAGATAFVLASGPSLDEQIDEVVEFSKGKISTEFIVIATDSALPVLASRKMVPDYVVALDAGYYNTLDFNESYESFRGEGSLPRLVMHPSLYPSVLRLPLFSEAYCFFTCKPNFEMPTTTPVGEVLFSCLLADIDGRAPSEIKVPLQTGFSSVDGLAEKRSNTPLYENIVEHSILTCGSSVASVALEAAVAMGVKDLIFYGLDMCYPFLHSHASFSMHDRYRLRRSYRLSPREQGDFLALQSLHASNKVGKNTTTAGKPVATKSGNPLKSRNPLKGDGIIVGPLQLQYREEMLSQIARAVEKGVKCYSRSPYFFSSKQHFGKLIFLKNPIDMEDPSAGNKTANAKPPMKSKIHLKEDDVKKTIACWYKAVVKDSTLLNQWLVEKSKTNGKVRAEETLTLLLEILLHLKQHASPLYKLFEINGMSHAALQNLYETDKAGDRLPYQKILAEMQRQFRVFLNYLPYTPSSPASKH